MLSQWLLSCLVLCQAISALSISRDADQQQQPLLPSSERSQLDVDSYDGSVMLGYMMHGDDGEKSIEIPLRTRMPSGRTLPVHPKMMRVLTASNRMGQAIPLEKLEGIVCRLEPRMHTHEKEAMGRRSWSEFSLRDGIVEFEKSDSKWFLGGVAVGAYECW
ncbi:hypothetical protein T440DRAFT_467915 [Plenodomus tracheiphilus IPT5]|uniref:Ubiquitin 3 binding protein But2 C-terminal domain-containing protein n=1 Tax=Plenodomus tracheiphilus IPT5 TaxID=1408161 RepID=A0A6A7B6J2_9PLEO|nr:hypothetical protein T440DRAFT_467915 [Plenodomus tracheiphilus IPT5]